MQEQIWLLKYLNVQTDLIRANNTIYYKSSDVFLQISTLLGKCFEIRVRQDLCPAKWSKTPKLILILNV